mgnify:CR=1 FL=1
MPRYPVTVTKRIADMKPGEFGYTDPWDSKGEPR